MKCKFRARARSLGLALWGYELGVADVLWAMDKFFLAGSRARHSTDCDALRFEKLPDVCT